MTTIERHPAYLYACRVVQGEIPAALPQLKRPYGKYVVKQAQRFKVIADGKDQTCYVDMKMLKKISRLMKLMQMPAGAASGKTVYESATGYQWLFYVATLCVMRADRPGRRKYQTAVLEIARKNYKTYTVAVEFILLMLTEPRFSKLFSVAPDGALSREVKVAIDEILKSSPALMPPEMPYRYFKPLRDTVTCKMNNNVFTPLNYSNSRLDGRLPTAFLADEVGALPNPYAVEAMRSGQVTIENKLGCIISTKYPTANNPFEDEVLAAKKVLDGLSSDDGLFALLYEPDEDLAKLWPECDDVLAQANPASMESEVFWEDLLKKRARAIDVDSTRENFLCKHCNIIYAGVTVENYIPIDILRKGRRKKLDWQGMEVYVGVDLAMSGDNTSVYMVGERNGCVQVGGMVFIPTDRVAEKKALERFDYDAEIKAGHVIACGDRTVDYAVVEDYVFDLEEKYGVTVLGVGYDRYNALSSAQKWERGRSGEKGKTDHDGYEVTEIRQHSDTLHPAFKYLSELAESGKLLYEENKLLEANFENARCTYDTNLNRYVNKKKSTGKVDVVFSIADGLYLYMQDKVLDNDDDFIVQEA